MKTPKQATCKTSIFAWRSRQGLGRITSARFALSTNLNSKASTGSSRRGGGLQGDSQGFGLGGDNIPTGFQEVAGTFGSINDGGELSKQLPTYFYDPNAYVDVNIPWNVRLSFDYNYRWSTSEPLQDKP